MSKFWAGRVPDSDDFGSPIDEEFIDGKSDQGPWGFFTLSNWSVYGVGRLGAGYGQRYKRQPDGRWLKVEG